MIPEGPLYHKSKKFVSAKNFLYSSICIGIFNLVLNKWAPVILVRQAINLLIIIALEYLFMFFIIKQMGYCKKWARTALLIIVIFITASYTILFRIDVYVNFFEGALILLQACFQITALIFLYSKESNNWFNSRTSAILP